MHSGVIFQPGTRVMSQAWVLQISAGGSLANTLANMGRLGTANADGGATSLKVAAASIVGCDALGSFHTAQQSQAGVHTLSRPLPDSATGGV